MKTQKNIKYILDEMQKLFGDYPATELFYETPFQLLVAVMLSAQTTDKQVNKVTEILFKKIKNPADVVAMGEEKFGQAIGSIGLRRGKAKNILKTAETLSSPPNPLLLNTPPSSSLGEGGLPSCSLSLSDRQGENVREGKVYRNAMEVYKYWGYYIPDTIEEMVKLPGVGIKTAKVVLYVLYKQRRVAVDTHVHRVMNRLGVVHTKTPEQTSKQLENIIPDEYKDIAHHVIIYFGRYLCTAKKPACERCPLRDVCERVNVKKGEEE